MTKRTVGMMGIGVVSLVCLSFTYGVSIGTYRTQKLAAIVTVEERASTTLIINRLLFNITQLEHELNTYGVIHCESSGEHHIYGDGGKSYGLAQFQQRTFYWLAAKERLITGRKRQLRWKNRFDQIYLLKWSLKNGYASHWTCWDKINKTTKGVS